MRRDHGPLALPALSGIPLFTTALLTIALLASGCSGPATPAASVPVPSATLPDGVSVGIHQSRTDLGERGLQVSITNDTDDDLTVTGVEFSAPQFADPVTWTGRGAATIAAGRTVDLPVALSAADCSPAAGSPTVLIEFEVGGSPAVAEVVPDDRLDRMPALLAEDCLAESVEKVATITADGLPRVDTVDGRPVISIDVRVVPTGASGSLTAGSFTIAAARGTTLLAVLDGPSLPLGLRIDASGGAESFTLDFVPNRCDPHAIAEDKRGTLLPLDVTTDDYAGTYFVPLPGDAKAAVYAFIAEACGMDAAG